MRSADGGSRVTTSQDTSVVPGEFDYSLKVDCTTVDATVAATHGLAIAFTVEAQDLQHLRYGNAAALTMNLSFWFRSPKTGIHTVSIFEEDANRAYVREFTIASADTFEFFSVTFPGDASGTINNDTGPGIAIVWPLAWGSDYEVAADGWRATGGTPSTTDEQQNLLDNTANNIYISGVQLEIGEVATVFEHRSIAEELVLCHRYYNRYTWPDAADSVGTGLSSSTTLAFCDIEWPVMRSSPTVADSSGTVFQICGNGIALNTTSVDTTVGISPHGMLFRCVTAASMTAGEGISVRTNTTDVYIEMDSEL